MHNGILVAVVALAVCSVVVAGPVLFVSGRAPNGSSGQTPIVTYKRERLLRHFEQLQSQLQDLRRRLDDDHPEVVTIRRKLQEVENALQPINFAWLLSKDLNTLDDAELREAVKILVRQVAHLNARVSQLEEVQFIPARSR